MKTINKILVLPLLMLSVTAVFAQKGHLDDFRYPDQRGVNVFESPKDDMSTFDGVKV